MGSSRVRSTPPRLEGLKYRTYGTYGTYGTVGTVYVCIPYASSCAPVTLWRLSSRVSTVVKNWTKVRPIADWL